MFMSVLGTAALGVTCQLQKANIVKQHCDQSQFEVSGVKPGCYFCNMSVIEKICVKPEFHRYQPTAMWFILRPRLTRH